VPVQYAKDQRPLDRSATVVKGRRLSAPEFANPLFGGQIMKRIALAATLSLSLLALGACGSSTSDRAISGGGIGAGAGAIGGWLLGAPVEGALLGGAVGAGAGALTKEKQINLGKPVWR
jgi:osmotically inducible lipoprotein OsmB